MDGAGTKTMTCRETIEILGEYRARELDAGQRASLEEHLAICRDCVAYLRSFEETIRLGKGAFARPEDDLLPDVPASLVRAILTARKAR
jgi:anti-sigma factor RsiW